MAQLVLSFWNKEVGDKHKGKNTKAVKFPFDTMGKGIDRVSKERKKGIVSMITLTTLWFGQMTEKYNGKQEGLEKVEVIK